MANVGAFTAGQIVLIDWRDARPHEPNKTRPAIVVEDTDLFDEAYPNVLVVPLAEHPDFSISRLTTTIEPTTENGCPATCYAVSHNVTATSKQRVRSVTASRVTDEQLAAIRRQCAESIGL